MTTLLEEAKAALVAMERMRKDCASWSGYAPKYVASTPWARDCFTQANAAITRLREAIARESATFDEALSHPGCERLKDFVETGPAQRAALELFVYLLRKRDGAQTKGVAGTAYYIEDRKPPFVRYYVSGKEIFPFGEEKPQCNPHPDAPHGFMRNESHSEERYVCECEFWEPPEEGR